MSRGIKLKNSGPEDLALICSYNETAQGFRRRAQGKMSNDSRPLLVVYSFALRRIPYTYWLVLGHACRQSRLPLTTPSGCEILNAVSGSKICMSYARLWGQM
jgi:hypothetical protein